MKVFGIAAIVVRSLMAVGLVAMGINHLVPKSARTMAAMIPPRMRGRGILSPESLVTFTGFCEIAGGVGLLMPRVRTPAGVALMVFYVAVFPANAHASGQPERFGRLASPFGPRLAAQVALIALTGAVSLPFARRR